MKTILAVIMLTIVTLSGCSSETPADTTGVYSNENFRASVEEDVIVVEIIAEDGTKMLYWQGSWHNGKAIVNSFGDRAALDSSLMGSGSANKQFEVSEDTLAFDFQAMGTKSTEILKKD